MILHKIKIEITKYYLYTYNPINYIIMELNLNDVILEFKDNNELVEDSITSDFFDKVYEFTDEQNRKFDSRKLLEWMNSTGNKWNPFTKKDFSVEQIEKIKILSQLSLVDELLVKIEEYHDLKINLDTMNKLTIKYIGPISRSNIYLKDICEKDNAFKYAFEKFKKENTSLLKLTYYYLMFKFH